MNKMCGNKACGGRALGIAMGITMLVLLTAGEAFAMDIGSSPPSPVTSVKGTSQTFAVCVLYNLVFVDWYINGTKVEEIANISTNSEGFYQFTNLANGSYNVTEEMRSNNNLQNYNRERRQRFLQLENPIGSGAPGADYKIRITSLSATACSDTSDSNFTIS